MGQCSYDNWEEQLEKKGQGEGSRGQSSFKVGQRGHEEWRLAFHTFLQFCFENKFIIVLMPVSESTVLGVYVSQLRLGLPLFHASSVLVILSLAKKSAQMARPYRPTDSSCLRFDQTLSIDCSDLDMIKQKYCLLFVYEVASSGKKTMLGNIPVNIQQTKGRGEKVYRLLECSDAQTTIAVAVDLKENHGSVISDTRTTEVHPSPLSFLRCRTSMRDEAALKSELLENPVVKQIGDIPLLKLSSLKSLQAKNEGKTVNYRPKNLSTIVSPDKIERLRQTLLNSRKNIFQKAAIFKETEVEGSTTSNILESMNYFTSQIQQTNESKSILNNDCSASREQSRKEQESSMIEIEYSNEDSSRDPCFRIVETFGNIRSYKSIDLEKKALNKEIAPVNQKKISHFKIQKTVSISFVSPSEKPFSIKSQISKSRIQYSIAHTDIEEMQAEHTNQLMTKLTEIENLNSRWTVMKERLQSLVRANEKITLDYKGLKNELDSEREVYSEKVKQLEEKVLDLKRQIDRLILQNSNKQAEMLKKETKLKEMHHLNQKYVRENNDLKKKIKSDAEMLKLMRIELSSSCTHQSNALTLSKNESVPVISKLNHRKSYTQASQLKPSHNPYSDMLRINIQKDAENTNGLQTAPVRGKIIKNQHRSPDSLSSSNIQSDSLENSLKFSPNLKIGYVGNSARSNVSSRGSSKGSKSGYFIDFMLQDKRQSEQLDLSIVTQDCFTKAKKPDFLTDKFAVKQKSLHKREKK